MAGNEIGTLVIRFNDGSEERLEYPRPTQDASSFVQRLEDMLNSQHLLLEVEGKLVVYPFRSIKAIEVSPIPEKLPRTVIRKARLVTSNR
jgi:hypothetical protein